MKQPQRGTVYVLPKPEAIREYARIICQAMAEHRNDPSFLEPHVIQGFSELIMLTAQVLVKHLNEGALVDSD